MKTTKVTTTDSETSVSLELDEIDMLPARLKAKATKAVGDVLVEQILLSVAAKKSPIAGRGAFEALTSKDYRAKKKSEVGNQMANLELSGKMLDALSWEKAENGIKIGVFGDAAPRADGHNNLSGKSQIPERRFLPGEGEQFKKQIQQITQKALAQVIAEATMIKASDFKRVKTKSDLYAILREKFPNSSNGKIKAFILMNSNMIAELRKANVLDML